MKKPSLRLGYTRSRMFRLSIEESYSPCDMVALLLVVLLAVLVGVVV